ncbi:hypothetical protein [Rhodococcus sp. BP22]|uniref:hypothetical protein n=1 Tax=Rhodococcus sp. BP22 TaxID=2758566 RepID=UPI001647EC0A|nr:hypothetical protein [Rhodococcus sp. BP22]
MLEIMLRAATGVVFIKHNCFGSRLNIRCSVKFLLRRLALGETVQRRDVSLHGGFTGWFHARCAVERLDIELVKIRFGYISISNHDFANINGAEMLFGIFNRK